MVRVLAAAGTPIVASTLLLTFSRGAIAALVVGVVVFVVLGRSSTLAGALLAVVPATAVAVLVTYHANLLATLHPTTPAAVAQGRTVAFAVAGCVAGAAIIRLLAVVLDRGWRG